MTLFLVITSILRGRLLVSEISRRPPEVMTFFLDRFYFRPAFGRMHLTLLSLHCPIAYLKKSTILFKISRVLSENAIVEAFSRILPTTEGLGPRLP